MALIKCPECGKDVSDKADVCIHCGYPLAKELNKSAVSEKNASEVERCPVDNAEGVSADPAPAKKPSHTSTKAESKQVMTNAIALCSCGRNKSKCAMEIRDNNILRMNYRDSEHFINKVKKGKVEPIFNFNKDVNVLYGIQEKLEALGCETKIVTIPEEEAEKLIPPMTVEELMAEAKKRQEKMDKLTQASVMSSSSTSIPKCPTCGSTNVSRIGAVNRGASVATWGMMSKKIDKTYKCNDCKYTW